MAATAVSGVTAGATIENTVTPSIDWTVASNEAMGAKRVKMRRASAAAAGSGSAGTDPDSMDGVIGHGPLEDGTAGSIAAATTTGVGTGSFQ